MPLELREDGTFEYFPMQIDEDHCVVLAQRFCCGECGEMIEHCGVSPDTEQQLIPYLNMDPATRMMEQKQYDKEYDFREIWASSERDADEVFPPE